jgi:hypothetical protein
MLFFLTSPSIIHQTTVRYSCAEQSVVVHLTFAQFFWPHTLFNWLLCAYRSRFPMDRGPVIRLVHTRTQSEMCPELPLILRYRQRSCFKSISFASKNFCRISRAVDEHENVGHIHGEYHQFAPTLLFSRRPHLTDTSPISPPTSMLVMVVVVVFYAHKWVRNAGFKLFAVHLSVVGWIVIVAT